MIGKQGAGWLDGRTAVVYGGSGSVGSSIAAAFAREGAAVTVVGRTRATLEAVAERIRADGGSARIAVADATDRAAVEAQLDTVTEEAGALDVVVNATSLYGGTQGTPLVDLDVETFLKPPIAALTTSFLVGTAAARRMRPGGAILLMSTSAAALPGRDRLHHFIAGFGVACAATEAFAQTLAGEAGRDGIRVVCLRPDALPETWAVDGIAADDPAHPAAAQYRYMTDGTVLGRMPTLQQVADAAVFAASERAGAMTGAVLNLTSGSIM